MQLVFKRLVGGLNEIYSSHQITSCTYCNFVYFCKKDVFQHIEIWLYHYRIYELSLDTDSFNTLFFLLHWTYSNVMQTGD